MPPLTFGWEGAFVVPETGRMDLPGPIERAARWQTILNARPIPPRSAQRVDRRPIPVTVRVVWERDGAELIDTEAIDWVGRDVLVQIADDRCQTKGAWLPAEDVRRR